MARSIDERIVQMSFNNQDFEKKASQTISTLDKLKNSLDFTQLTKNFTDLNDTANHLNFTPVYNSIQSIGSGFSWMEEIAVGALRRIGEQAIATAENLLKAVTIEPFRISWSKYDEGIASQQAIMSAVEGKTNELTGEIYDMSSVIERVDLLKWYSDETSYSITQMTNAVGQFTASGQDLDKSVTAVMGIANACADAGVSTQKAESAFIGFSKAIGAGSLTLGTWNMQLKTSGITNSERFRKTLLDQAAAVGTLTKSLNAAGEAVYTYGGKEVNTANMTEFLNKGIITSEVLINTLNKYADTTTKIRDIQNHDVSAIIELYQNAGKEMSSTMKDWVDEVSNTDDYVAASEVIEQLTKAYEELGIEVPQSLAAYRRAQEAISFSQAIDATKDAVSSQFSNIYETLFGNYEEARKLWSNVANDLNTWFVGPLYDLVDSFAYAKQAWDSSMDVFADGNQSSATQIIAIYRALSEVIYTLSDQISNIFSTVFGESASIEDTGKKIFDTLEFIRSKLWDINEFFSQEEGVSAWTQIRKVLEGILTIIHSIGTIAKTIWNDFVEPLGSMLKPILEDIFDIFGNIGDILKNTGEDVENNLSPLQNILKGILNILEPIIGFIGTLVKGIKEWTSSIASKEMEEGAEHVSVFAKALELVGNVIIWIAGVFNGTINIFEGIGDVLGTLFDKIKGSIGNLLESHGNDIAGLAEGGILGVLAIGMQTAISKVKDIKFDTVNIKDIISGIIKGFMGGDKEGEANFFTKIIDGFTDTLNKARDALNSFSESLKVKILKEIANAIVKLAVALLVISLVDADKIASSLGAMMAVLGEALAAMAIMGQIDGGKNLMQSAKALSKIASAIVVLAIALKILSSIDGESMMVGLAGLGIALAEVMAFMLVINGVSKNDDGKKMQQMGKSMKSIGAGLIEIALALKIAASINPEQLGTALLGLGGALGGVLAFVLILSNFSGKNGSSTMKAAGAALVGIGFGLIEIAAAIKILSTINVAEMGTAMEGLILGLASIGVFIAAMSNFVGAGSFALISVSLIAFSTALIILAAAMKMMGSMRMETIGKGLLAMAGGLAVILAMSVPLGLLSPLILLTAASIAAFGLALSAAAKGIFEFTGSFALLQSMGQDISLALMDIFVNAVAAIVQVLPALFLGIIKAILNVADELVKLASQLIRILATALTENIPVIVETSLGILIAVMTAIRDNIYQITDLGLEILIGFLQGIRDNIGEVVTVAAEIIAALAVALTENLLMLIDTGYQMIVNFINGLAETIRSNGPELGAAIGNLASAILEGIAGGLLSSVATFGSNMIEFGMGIVDGIKSWFSGTDISEANNETGGQIITDVNQGMLDSEDTILETAEQIGKNTAEGMDAQEEATTSGKNTMAGLLVGLTDPAYLAQIAEAGTAAGITFKDAYNLAMDEHSPSKEMEKSGRFTIAGLIKGLSNIGEVEKVGTSIGERVRESISNAVGLIEEIVDQDLNPTITPVLDLSNVTDGASTISDLLSNDTAYKSALAINNARLAYAGNQNSGVYSPTINVNFTVNQAGGELTPAVISGFTDQIANELNIKYGKMLRR